MTQFIYILYNVLIILIKPFLFFLVQYRILIKKEDKLRYKEKFGIYNAQRPKGKLIWIHAASVGEINSIITLIKELNSQNSQLIILITSVTVTSAKIVKDKICPISPNIIHQFVPFDCLLFVKKFLNHWQPEIAVFVESELWPNLLLETKKISKKVFLINGRLSDQSFARWDKFGKIILNITKL